jgi:mRNA-degrading endonuclease toxin of MazEF toxin-antitoxin module
MTGGGQVPDQLQRGDVVLAPDPFRDRPDSVRPWTVVNNDRHPFDGEQYLPMALTTKTWYEDRIPIRDDHFRSGQTPADSSIVPHAVASLQPSMVTDHVCRLWSNPLDRAVDRLPTYLIATCDASGA